MNYYRRGANVERAAVNQHIKDGAIFAGRFAASKCKGKLKIDVVALYPPKQKSHTREGIYYFPAILVLEQYKKGKVSNSRDRKKFYAVDLPTWTHIRREFIEVK